MEAEAVQPLINRAKELFTKVFGGEAEIITSAPGRLNFGGEHCDYMGKVFFNLIVVTIALPCLLGVFSADDRV